MSSCSRVRTTNDTGRIRLDNHFRGAFIERFLRNGATEICVPPDPEHASGVSIDMKRKEHLRVAFGHAEQRDPTTDLYLDDSAVRAGEHYAGQTVAGLYLEDIDEARLQCAAWQNRTP